LITASLQQNVEYVALVSKGKLAESEVTFSLKFEAVCTCQKQSPDICFGIIGRNFNIPAGLRTADGSDKLTLSCGSKQANLNDFIFNFQVAESGVYRISVINVKNGNSTLQITDCNLDDVFSCQAGNAANSGGSVVELFLPAQRNLFGTVSKLDQSTSEVSGKHLAA
jgi:hypothetical protein